MKAKNLITATLLATIMAFSTASFAQKAKANGQHKEKMEQHIKEFSTRLNLSADQETRIREIMKQSRTEMRTMRESKKDAPKEEKRTAMKDLKKKTDEKIKAVLDPKQQELYKQYKEEKRQERKNKMEQKKADPTLQELEDESIF